MYYKHVDISCTEDTKQNETIGETQGPTDERILYQKPPHQLDETDDLNNDGTDNNGVDNNGNNNGNESL